MKTDHRREVTLINLVLAALTLVALAYIGYKASAAGQQYPPVPPYPGTRLSALLVPGTSTYDLNEDANQIKTVMKQEKIDRVLANRFTNLSPVIAAAPDQQQGWLKVLSAEANDAAYLQHTQSTALISEIGHQQAALANHLQLPASDFLTLGKEITLAKVADDQRAAEAMLTQLSAQLNKAVASAGISGLEATNLSDDLTTLNADTASSGQLSAATETSALNGANPEVTRLNLATAEVDIAAALNAAQTVISSL